MRSLPEGTVTFLFAEVEDGARLAGEFPEQYPPALARCRTIVGEAVARYGGFVVEVAGDGMRAAFASAREAVAAATGAQLRLQTAVWDQIDTPRLAVALHSGEVELRDEQYSGPPLRRCARLLDIAHGDQTLLSGVTASLVRDVAPPHVGLLDLGLHRLKDLAEPEQVFQLVHPDLQAEFPALRSLDALQHNLPIQLTSFVGREQEIVELEGLLARCRLLTLTGTGGAGKTRLALQVAAQVVDRFVDGAWLVELAPVAEPRHIARAIAEVVQVREEPSRPLPRTLQEQLRAKQMLLLLDNCEHLIDACADLAGALIRECPGIRILSTSREPLGVPGETVWRVPSLAVPDRIGVATVENLTHYAAPRLFIERAVSARPDFTVTDHNATALAQVCWRLDGIPLAIELAAARISVLSLEQIAQRLDDLFRLLVSGQRTVQARQQTLRAAIDWSYDLLSETERTFFARLSVFVGGWSLEAAEGICTGGGIQQHEVLDLLQQFVDKSLVTAHEIGSAVRYGLLETLREYAAEKLRASGEVAAVRDRHAHWHLELAEHVEPLLLGFEQGGWLETLEHEHDNFRAAMKWLMETVQGEAAMRLTGAMWRFWEAHAHFAEGRRLLKQVLETVPSASAAARAKALTGAGMLASRQGDFAEAVRFLEASFSEYDALGDRRGMAYALTYLAVQAQEQGQADRAAALHQQSIELYESLGEDQHGLARSLNNLGYHLLLQGDAREAAPYLERSLALGRELGDGRLIAVVLYNLAWVAQKEPNLERAQTLYDESLGLFRLAHDTRWIAFVLQELGGLAQARGQFERAFGLVAESLTLFRDVGEKAGLALCLERLAKLAIAMGDTARAGFLFGAAEILRERQHYPLHAGEIDDYQRWIAQGRSVSGPHAWATGWQAGRMAPPAEAITVALSAPSTDRAEPTLQASAVLTRRELEVAERLARGLTNRQIAEELVIGERTVDAHVDHIRDKLGVRSRASIASWVTAGRPPTVG
jgi:predicted ATPase/class 3 adenylate cyclase/DNA-binding CsgD family transcriptional regulator